jgi:hypothetical protein
MIYCIVYILLQDEHEQIRSKNQTQYSNIDPLSMENGSCSGGDRAQALHLMNAWDDYKSMDYTHCVSIHIVQLQHTIE